MARLADRIAAEADRTAEAEVRTFPAADPAADRTVRIDFRDLSWTKLRHRRSRDA